MEEKNGRHKSNLLEEKRYEKTLFILHKNFILIFWNTCILYRSKNQQYSCHKIYYLIDNLFVSCPYYSSTTHAVNSTKSPRIHITLTRSV
jgi:hypothetical protein